MNSGAMIYWKADLTVEVQRNDAANVALYFVTPASTTIGKPVVQSGAQRIPDFYTVVADSVEVK
jgi:hypothetical protein